ncbi:hypothetical protein GQX74_010440 [Glossina fuscipes]|nr:hypothetical protein GQX74_010440 [Glossina fuscipes]
MYTTRAYGSKIRHARRARRIPTLVFAVECQDVKAKEKKKWKYFTRVFTPFYMLISYDDDDDDNDDDDDDDEDNDNNTNTQILCRDCLSASIAKSKISNFSSSTGSNPPETFNYFDIMFINDFITLPFKHFK